MKVATRESERTLLLELFGPFPDSDPDRLTTEDQIRVALTGRDDFVIILQGFDVLHDHELGLLVRWLRAAEVMRGWDRPIRIVAESAHVRSVFRVTDSPFLAFATVQEALASPPR